MKYSIYQIKKDAKYALYRFSSYESLKGSGLDKDMYDLVYEGTEKNLNVEYLYDLFQHDNPSCPSDFAGHSLSVSDVIEFYDDGLDPVLFYCDNIGFKATRWKDQSRKLERPDVLAAEASEKIKTYEFSFSKEIDIFNNVQMCAQTQEEAVSLFDDYCCENGLTISPAEYSISVVYDEDDAKVYGDNYFDPRKSIHFPGIENGCGRLVVNVAGGRLCVDVCTDPYCPGVDIEFISNNEAESDKFLSRPRVLIETPCPDDGKLGKLRALIWNNPTSEDYSYSFEFTDYTKGENSCPQRSKKQ